MGLMHIDQRDTLYKSYGSKNSLGVTWGSQGQNVIFDSKCCISSLLNKITIGLMHIH